MNTYPKRVAENILPLSISGTLPEAFQEWYFTDNVHDHEIAEHDCGLCDQEQLRYHFEIRNHNTGHILWVGSSCILKFQVKVYDQGTILNQDQSKQKLAALTQKMRLDSCIRALKKLADEEDNDILGNALNYYLKNKYLTPKFAFVVFWRLSKHKIDHSPSFFKISLKKNLHKEALKNMPTDRVHLIWAALSTSQRKLAIEYGHIPPPS